MEQNVQDVLELQAQRAIKALEKNQINGYYVKTKEDVVAKVQEILQEGDSVAVGGSRTLFETGLIDHLRSGRYEFFDRHAPGLNHDQIDEIHRKAFSADGYLCSCNALTLNGEIYNVDGNGNRVAAMAFGPKKVIVVAGINKLVRNLEEAQERVRMIAAPANARRFPGEMTCLNFGQCANCHDKGRICCSFLTTAFQRNPQRMHVILVGEELGY